MRLKKPVLEPRSHTDPGFNSWRNPVYSLFAAETRKDRYPCAQRYSHAERCSGAGHNTLDERCNC